MQVQERRCQELDHNGFAENINLVLPEELFVRIFTLLTHIELSSAALVCTKWRRIALGPQIWNHLYKKEIFSNFFDFGKSRTEYFHAKRSRDFQLLSYYHRHHIDSLIGLPIVFSGVNAKQKIVLVTKKNLELRNAISQFPFASMSLCKSLNSVDNFLTTSEVFMTAALAHDGLTLFALSNKKFYSYNTKTFALKKTKYKEIFKSPVISSQGIIAEIRACDLMIRSFNDIDRQVPLSHTCDIDSFAFSPNGRMVAVLSDKSTLTLWDLLSSSKPIYEKTFDIPLRSYQFSKDNNYILICFKSEILIIKISDMREKRYRCKCTALLADMRLSHHGSILLAHDNFTLYIWDLNRRSERPIFDLPFCKKIFHIEITENGCFFLVMTGYDYILIDALMRNYLYIPNPSEEKISHIHWHGQQLIIQRENSVEAISLETLSDFINSPLIWQNTCHQIETCINNRVTGPLKLSCKSFLSDLIKDDEHNSVMTTLKNFKSSFLKQLKKPKEIWHDGQMNRTFINYTNHEISLRQNQIEMNGNDLFQLSNGDKLFIFEDEMHKLYILLGKVMHIKPCPECFPHAVLSKTEEIRKFLKENNEKIIRLFNNLIANKLVPDGINLWKPRSLWRGEVSKNIFFEVLNYTDFSFTFNKNRVPMINNFTLSDREQYNEVSSLVTVLPDPRDHNSIVVIDKVIDEAKLTTRFFKRWKKVAFYGATSHKV